jgi:predicted negative regulator of RcsB-dependent stress response
MLGDLYREKGDLIEAHTMWNKAVTFDPKNPEANIRL